MSKHVENWHGHHTLNHLPYKNIHAFFLNFLVLLFLILLFAADEEKFRFKDEPGSTTASWPNAARDGVDFKLS